MEILTHTSDDNCAKLNAEHDLNGLDVFILNKFVNGKDLNCKLVCSEIGCVAVIMLLGNEDIHNCDSLLLLLLLLNLVYYVRGH